MKRIPHELIAQLCQAMASPTRVYGLSLLALGPWSVGQLAEELGEGITAARKKKPTPISYLVMEQANHSFYSRRSFLRLSGALGLGYAFLASTAGVVRAASVKSSDSVAGVPGLLFKTFEAGGIAHYSYFIGDGINGTAVIIDPKRDIDDYIALAEKHRMKITHVLETHIHADFVSGSRELAERIGAIVCASIEGGSKYGFPVQPLRDGDVIETGNIRIKAIHTPGHTPEHMSYLASSRSKPQEFWGLFTGDFLFSGAVGRPDLMGVGNTDALAHKLWESLQGAYNHLPDELPIYPAHGPGSPCGAGIVAREGTPTLGIERYSNPAMQFKDREKFISNLLDSQPPVPYYWPRMKEINAAGPEILGSLPDPQKLPFAEFRTTIGSKDVQLLDTRNMLGFGGGHIPGALNIGYAPSVSMWGGWLLDPERPVAIITPSEGHAREVARWLVRIGVTRFAGSLVGGMDAWAKNAGEFSAIRQLTVQELNKRTSDKNLQIVDVRSPSEWDHGHIPNASYMFLPEIPKRMGELDRSRPVATYCGTGYRASIAASLLKRQGFDVYSVPGSFEGWLSAGYEVVVPSSRGKASDTRRS